MAHVVGASLFFFKGGIFFLILHINEEAWPPLYAPLLVSNDIPSLKWATPLGERLVELGEAFVGEEGSHFHGPLLFNIFFPWETFQDFWCEALGEEKLVERRRKRAVFLAHALKQQLGGGAILQFCGLIENSWSRIHDSLELW
eukprot:Gb_27781 [translate_table: standard]